MFQAVLIDVFRESFAVGSPPNSIDKEGTVCSEHLYQVFARQIGDPKKFPLAHSMF